MFTLPVFRALAELALALPLRTEAARDQDSARP